MYDTGRDTLSDLMDLNNLNINNRLNRSMKINAIITTVFVPLSVIAGIYGMNFRHIPELEWRAGYPFALIMIAVTAGFMIYVMRRNKVL
jgi:magnesium transporter